MSQSLRGRTRGGRIIDFPAVPCRNGVGRGIILTRGLALSLQDKSDSDTPRAPDHVQIERRREPDENEVKRIFEEQLINLARTGQGCMIRLSLQYFPRCTDTLYFVEKIMEYMLYSSKLVNVFLKSFRAITLLEKFGDSIKKNIFLTLQKNFKQMVVSMDEEDLKAEERKKICHFSQFTTLFYFWFRIRIDSTTRYAVLEKPVIKCMYYLFKTKGEKEAAVLAKAVAMNYNALCVDNEDEMLRLSVLIRRFLASGDGSQKLRTWLLACLDFMFYRKDGMPEALEKYSETTLDEEWFNSGIKPPHKLVDIPPDVLKAAADMFEPDLRTKYRHFQSLV